MSDITPSTPSSEKKACELPGPLLDFKADGEDYKTHAEELTPNDIIKDFVGLDPATHYLKRIDGHHPESFQGKGDAPIKMQNHMKFLVICTGPMTVSDPATSFGIAAFLQGLTVLGYKPITLPDKPNHVFFDYEVPSGKHIGLKIKQGFIVPDDFPATTPSGPHVSVELYPVKSGGEHPTGGIHTSPPFQEALGGKWQYWSRPFPSWAQCKKPVATYMSHIRRLWDSQ